MKRRFPVLAILLLGGAAFAGRIEILSPSEGAEVAVLNAANKAFLAASPEARDAMVRGAESRARLRAAGSRPERLTVAWRHVADAGEKPADSFLVVVRRTADGALFATARVRGTSLDLCNFEVGCDYELSVSAYGRKERGLFDTAVRRFRTEDAAPRVLFVEGVLNARDLGGWKVADGRRIRQGLLFRSQAFNDNVDYVAVRDPKTGNKTPKPERAWKPGKVRGTPESRRACRLALGIRTEIDLRRPENETWHVTASPLGRSVRYAPIPGSSYARMGTELGKARFAQAFRVLTDRKNYPVSFHCIAGADRTGSFAYILGALLGMRAEDLAADYFFTCFVNAAPWPFLEGRDVRYPELVKVLDGYAGATLSEKAEAYARDCGIGPAEIDAFRQIMLEAPPSETGDVYAAFMAANEKERRAMLADPQTRAAMQKAGTPKTGRVGDVPRWCGAVPNMRDLGGWRAMDGKRLRYGRLVRSARFGFTGANPEEAVRTFGIRTDLDLRKPGGEKLGLGTHYVNLSAPAYGGVLVGGQAWFRKVFDVLLDRSNYPIAVHCTKGADRTGTLVALVAFLVGVDEDDVAKDWQLTAFSNGNLLFEDTRFDGLLAELAKRPGATWREKAEAFARECGVTDEEIGRLREWLLEAPTAVIGVVSDTHVSGPKSAVRGKSGFNEGCRRALAWFSRQGVDVVVNAGDMTEGGDLAEVDLYRAWYDEAFPSGKCFDGSHAVAHVSVWGNHDALSSKYLRDLNRHGELLPTSILTNHEKATRTLDGVARKAGWFDRSVHGVRFVGVDWKRDKDLAAALDGIVAQGRGDELLVYLRHSPEDDGGAWARLAARGDAIRISGHTHFPLDNPKSYSADCLPLMMLSGSTMRLGHLENGMGVGRLGTLARHAAILRIWSDRVTVERRELFHDEPLGPELSFLRNAR